MAVTLRYWFSMMVTVLLIAICICMIGSVRQVIAADGAVENFYSYNPWGEDITAAGNESISNPLRFTGQYFDDEIGQNLLSINLLCEAIKERY